MLRSGEGDIELEAEINRLFSVIVFSKKSNSLIFEKWKSNQAQRADLSGAVGSTNFSISSSTGIPNVIHESVSVIENETTIDEERRQLYENLKHLEATLTKEGELAAEELLISYTQTFQPWVKYLIFSILLIFVGSIFYIFLSI